MAELLALKPGVSTSHEVDSAPPLFKVVLLSALAGGMGWGIRGQYGHETGAMIAGLLVGLVLVVMFRPRASPLAAARAAAFCAAAIGFGGAMTYGQTVGFTHNPQMVGNWSALGWGMLGLGIKGALWIGFAGAFLGMGLSGRQYSPREIALLLGGMLLLMLLGMWALNMPFDPANRVVPRIYFSADWRWYPNAGPELKPRREFWGGFLFALVGLILYLGWFRRDILARNLALWGCLGGLGFPIGQCLQAWHAWNREAIRASEFASFDRLINWWNFMETTFGLVLGAALALGLWLNRRRIAPLDADPVVSIKPAAEFALLAVHVPLIFLWEFASIGPLDQVGDLGIPRSLIPLICIAGGRFWPYLMMLPVIALPILGKTLDEFGLEPATLSAGLAMLPVLAILTVIALRCALATATVPKPTAANQLGLLLLISAWCYFLLNYAFFRFPWPWQTWTARTPNAIIYTVCLIALTWLALSVRRREVRMHCPAPGSAV